MKFAILSDAHDNLPNLAKAVEIANSQGCEALLFAGDLNFPGAVEFLAKFNGPVHMIWGNNEGEKLGVINKVNHFDSITHHGNECELSFDGLNVFMTHYPEIALLAENSPKYQLIVYGHTHTYEERASETSIVVNPGAVLGYPNEPSFVIFDTTTKQIERINL